VELQQQHRVPGLGELFVRIRGVGADGGSCGPELGLAQEVFAAPVTSFRPSLGRVDAAVKLEVKLAGPHRRVRIVAFGLLEECQGSGHRHGRRTLERLRPGGRSEHLAGGSATAVAVAEGHERDVGCALFGVLALRSRQLLTGEHRVVGVDGREVREDAGAVDALPGEGVMRHRVRLVPADLLGQKVP